MKLTKKLEAEILKAYHEYWNAYLKGDMQAMSYWLHEDVQMIGSGRGEFFKNKKQTLKYYKSTAAQVAGKADMRNRKINVTTVGNQILVSEECDFFVLIDSVWTFYEQGRISTLFVKTNKGWKIIEEHGSMPDARTAEGEQVNTDKIKAENIRLKDAVKRRTIELEEKNHELKIETSLEKVRAVAMGMTRPDDLLHICRSLFNELRRLRFTEIRNAIINTFENKKPFFLDYDYSDLLGGTITKIPINANTIIKNHLKRIKKGSEAFSETIVTESEIKKWVVDRRKRGEPEDPRLKKLKLLCYYFYSIGPAAIGISTYRKIGEEKLEILKRFRNVFKLSYQRYIDIAKAEAQAQEAQLESALERVRAVVMAMHTPGDLSVIGKTIYQQLKSLGFSGIRNTEIIINNDNKERIKTYHYSDYGKEEIIEINYKENPIVKKWANDLRKADNAFVPVSIPKREIKKWDQYRKKIGYKNDPKMSKANAVYYYSYSIGLGALSVSSWQQLHEEQIKTLERFRNVFNLSYKRYIDIAKAEAQAREAEIELALERVRARSLAMHKTSELQEVIHGVHKELLHLNLSIDGGSFVVINADVDPELRCWGSGGTADTSEEILVPHFNMPFCTNLIKGIKKAPGFFTEEFSQKEKKEFFTKLFKQKPWSQLSNKQKKEMLSSPGGYTRSVAVSKHTSIFIINHQGKKFTDAENDILKRFAKVFEQTYTRFLDLQKAEAQARESQLEASFEKIRAQAMAMHKSEELLNVCEVMYKELKALGFDEIRNAMIHTFNDKNDFFLDYDYSGNSGKRISKIPAIGFGILENYLKEINKSKDAIFEFVLKGKALQDWRKIRRVTGQLEDKRIDTAKALYYYYYSTGKGDVGISTFSPVSKEKIQVLERFRNVFQLSYQRFDDLQNAEAQAKESEIQLALERVRARSLAMHHTSELQEVVNITAQQLLGIGMDINGGVFICINSEVDKELSIWASGGMADYMQKAIAPELNKPIFLNARNAIKKGNSFLIESFSDQEKQELFTHLFKYEPWKSLPMKRKKELLSRKGGFARSIVISQHTSISITNHYGKAFTDEENEILKRFGKVFEQSYIRFLDLQKAEAQAREAQIEAAVERVRAISLAMHHSDEIHEVVRTLRHELFGLKLEGIGGATICLKQPDGRIRFWDITDIESTGRYAWDILFDMDNIDPHLWVKRIWNSRKKIISAEQDSADLKRALKWLGQYNKKTADDISKLLKANKITHGWHRAVKLSRGILITDFSNIPPAEIDSILLKISAAFDLAYQRFLDLQKAEAQAREAQIEAALERVRSRAMAMHTSDELKEVAKEMRNQLHLLGQKELETCAIHLWDESSEQFEAWAALRSPDNTGKIIESESKFKIKGIKILEENFQHYRDGKKDYVLINDVAKARQFFEALKPVDPKAYAFLSPTIKNKKPRDISAYWAVADFDGGSLVMVTMNPPEENSRALLRRFADVFGLAYRRFSDLQKAEAQAREAQIEAALEKVRSGSLAMHRSDELQAVVNIVIERLKELNIVLDTTNILIFNDKEKIIEYWTGSNSTGTQLSASWKVPYANFLYYKAIRKARENKEEIFTGYYSFEEKRKMFNYLFEETDFRNLSTERKKFILDSPRATIVSAIVNDVAIQVISYSRVSFARDEIEIVKRFAKVFSQAYTRFLDLQKAEAQARGAQIQLALERVRAKTMAMQKQKDLFDVVNVFGEQLIILGLKVDYVSIMYGKISKSRDWNLWGCVPGLEYSSQNNLIPYKKTAYFTRTAENIEAFERTGNPIQVKTFTKKEKDDFLDHYFSFAEPLPDDFKKHLYDAPGSGIVDAFLNEVTVSICRYDFGSYTEEELDIFKRFSNEFRQSYIRFLDLQKAEAQAREAQIEASLERVRSRAMAMHTSDELKEVAKEMRTQLHLLGQKELETCAIHLWDESSGQFEAWAALRSPDNTGKIIESESTFKIKGIKILEENFQHYRDGKKDYVLINDVAKARQFFEALKPVDPKAYAFLSPTIKNKKPRDISAYWAVADFAGGSLAMVTMNPPEENSRALLRRFADVFGLAYRRFSDLQKAEAQAREAEIELALERVRARTMAMQKSDELSEASNVLFQQLKVLGEEIDQISIIIFEKIHTEMTVYATTHGNQWTHAAKIPLNKHSVYQQVFTGWKNQKNSLVIDIEGEELKALNKFKLENPDYQVTAEDLPKDRWIIYNAYFSKGSLGICSTTPKSEESIHLYVRFAQVFDLTYTRFLDLQKAEAQAREAQIQLALERVRARTMAMQKSEELKDVINLVYEQLTHLNIHVEHCGFLIDYKTRDDLHIWLADEHLAPSEVIFPWFDCPPNNAIREAKDKGEDFFFYHLNFEEKNKFYRDLFKLIPGIPEETIAYYLHCPGLAGSGVLLESIGLYIENFSGTEYTEEENAVLMRFGKVFQQTYTRFLDLQKAEAQAREAQIEAALERIRSKVTAMQESSDLFDIVVAMRNEFILLGHQADYFWHMRWGPENYELSMTSEDGSRLGMVINVPKFVHQQIPRLDEWEKSDSPIFVLALNAEEAWDYVDKMNTYGSFELIDPHAPTEEDIRHIGGLTFIIARTTHGEIGFSLAGEVHQPPKESQETLIRFASVFDLAYRRFEDLKEAEKRNRETQIELALERVRARTMAMQKSDELNPTADLLFEQLRLLGAELQGVAFAICDKDSDIVQKWTSIGVFSFSSSIEPAELNMYEAWKNKVPLFEEVFEGERIKKYYETLMEVPAFKQGLQQLLDAGIPIPTWQKNHAVSFQQGYLLIITTKPFAETQIFIRFGKVFEQTYTRFLDLKKAEAQAREAQIEAALERVRSRSMAMHKSEELLEVINVVSNQLQQLDIRFGFVCFGVIHPQGNLDFWMAAPGIGQPENIHMPFVNNPITNSLIEAHKKGTRILKDFFPKEVMLEWSKVFFENNPDSQIMAQSKEYIQESPGLVRTSVLLKEIDVFAGKFADKPFTDEQNEIIVRFANVFEQSYIRFLDLQKAEMQAREAKIEVSLEKVRTVALILKKSDEMLDVVQALYEALYDLGFTNIRNSIIDVHNPQKETFLDYDYSPQLGRSITEMSYYDSPFIENQVRKTEADNDAFFELILEGKELQELIDMRLKNGEAEDPRLRQTKQLTYNLYSFGNGAIGISNFGLLSDEQKEILKRFRNVFAFAYKRYSDMVQAEALAREAQIEAALEKVRSRTLAMQKSDELADTAAVLFQQLITLGIAPNRLFIIIMKAGSSDLEAWVTDEDGSKVSLGFTANYQNNPSIQKMYEGWQQQKKSLVIDMQGEELQQYFHYLHDELKVPFKGGLEQKRRIQHLAYFSHGLIGMASPEEQPAETIQLLERFAAVFNLTFTRFNDLKIAEAHAIQAEQDLIAIKEAKQKAEEALTELQSTQKQLIQSEKMASLGELTAGIAHEIQNPLNFVNNFSEVSKELLDEMKEAIEKGDTEDAKQIMNDVIQNLEKINHHGKRADGIVKGMLQHSRSSTGQKELTDINVLCDEYLRLSYHGLRAKDKTFNAKFETSFDESIGKVNIVPQEIGRVILNLINNAFYAVSEKKKMEDENYEPTVIVSTKKENETVLISVKDNGNGIPENIKDKIFQPFFTTKPTGQGTGLGLSLSYDIVKAHGGEVNVNTKEGEGAAFIIQLTDA